MVEGIGGGAHFSFHNSPSHLPLRQKTKWNPWPPGLCLSPSDMYCISIRLRSSSCYNHASSMIFVGGLPLKDSLVSCLVDMYHVATHLTSLIYSSICITLSIYLNNTLNRQYWHTTSTSNAFNGYMRGYLLSAPHNG